MQKIIFDTNIYHKLLCDSQTVSHVKTLIQKNLTEIVVPKTLEDELMQSPHEGILNLFPIKLSHDSVFIVGYTKVGTAVPGDGLVYKSHRGVSNSLNDAIIADAAHAQCDIFVSDDKRCRNRLKKISEKCLCLSFEEFKEWLSSD